MYGANWRDFVQVRFQIWKRENAASGGGSSEGKPMSLFLQAGCGSAVIHLSVRARAEFPKSCNGGAPQGVE